MCSAEEWGSCLAGAVLHAVQTPSGMKDDVRQGSPHDACNVVPDEAAGMPSSIWKWSDVDPEIEEICCNTYYPHSQDSTLPSSWPFPAARAAK